MDYHNLLWEIQLTRQNGKGWQRVLNTAHVVNPTFTRGQLTNYCWVYQIKQNIILPFPSFFGCYIV